MMSSISTFTFSSTSMPLAGARSARSSNLESCDIARTPKVQQKNRPAAPFSFPIPFKLSLFSFLVDESPKVECIVPCGTTRAFYDPWFERELLLLVRDSLGKRAHRRRSSLTARPHPTRPRSFTNSPIEPSHQFPRRASTPLPPSSPKKKAWGLARAWRGGLARGVNDS